MINFKSIIDFEYLKNEIILMDLYKPAITPVY